MLYDPCCHTNFIEAVQNALDVLFIRLQDLIFILVGDALVPQSVDDLFPPEVAHEQLKRDIVRTLLLFDRVPTLGSPISIVNFSEVFKESTDVFFGVFEFSAGHFGRII